MQVENITVYDLNSLFDPDQIRNGSSIQTLKTWGGLKGLENKLSTNFKKGLSQLDNQHLRKQLYGDNQGINRPSKTIKQIMAEQLQDKIIRILLMATVLIFVFGAITKGFNSGLIEAVSIIVAIFINMFAVAIKSLIQNEELRKFKEFTNKKYVNVIRRGELNKICTNDLLVGDIVLIQAGQIIEVDGILIETQEGSIIVDQSSITGEIDQIQKMVPESYQAVEKRNPFLISFSRIISGKGQMVVAAVGANSYYGKLKAIIQQSSDQTPLQQNLRTIVQKVGQYAILLATIVFLIMVTHYLYICIISESFFQSFFSFNTLYWIVEYFIIGCVIMLVAVPEGLPTAVITCIALNIMKMKQQNIILRKMDSCETMAFVNNILISQTQMEGNIIKEDVKKCYNLGVKIRIFSRNDKNSVVQIAKDAGLLNNNWQEREDDYSVMEGKNFRQFVGGIIKNQDDGDEYPFQKIGNIQNFKLVADQLCVMYQFTQQDKYLMILGLKQLGCVVTVIGYNANQIQAMRKADVGLSMGISGTQAIWDASGIVLANDSFHSILTSIKWGKNLCESIRKLLQFELTGILVLLFMIVVGCVFDGEPLLSVASMVWISLIMDSFGTVVFAKQGSNEALNRKQQKRGQLLSMSLRKNVFIQTVFQIIILCLILFFGPQLFSYFNIGQLVKSTQKHYTIFFNVFVFLQIFNAVNSRQPEDTQINVFKHIHYSSYFLPILLLTIIIQLLIVQFGANLFRTAQLTFSEHIMCILLASTSLIACFFGKTLLRNMNVKKQTVNIGISQIEHNISFQ